MQLHPWGFPLQWLQSENLLVLPCSVGSAVTQSSLVPIDPTNDWRRYVHLEKLGKLTGVKPWSNVQCRAPWNIAWHDWGSGRKKRPAALCRQKCVAGTWRVCQNLASAALKPRSSHRTLQTTASWETCLLLTSQEPFQTPSLYNVANPMPNAINHQYCGWL
jgi:hypothetical protein